MARYIDADLLWELIDGGFDIEFDEVLKPHVLRMIDESETVDVAPVIHARWEWKLADNGWADTTCSNCGQVWNMDVHEYLDYDYCPYCGAKMDEVS